MKRSRFLKSSFANFQKWPSFNNGVWGSPSKDSFGLVPQPTAEGDIVVVLFGANVPAILRRTSNPGTFEYHLIGPACIHGIMHGEVLDALSETDLHTQEVRLV
jgi:hypothetical protein